MTRRGYTLMEMLVVIALGTVLLGVAVGVLHLLMRTQHSGRESVYQTETVARLAEQFRSDARAALRPIAAEGEPKDRWRFALAADRTVTYRLRPGEIERREQIAAKQVRQESYTLPRNYLAEITVRTDATPAMASLVLAPSGLASPAGREIRIDAALGADHRFAKSSEGGH